MQKANFRCRKQLSEEESPKGVLEALLQLDWLRIAEWAYGGIFAVGANLKTKTRACILGFFETSQIHKLVWPFLVLLAILANI